MQLPGLDIDEVIYSVILTLILSCFSYYFGLKVTYICELWCRLPSQLNMAFGGKLPPSHPMALFIWLALHTIEALMLPSQPLSLLNTPRLIARAEQGVTLKPYTGNGAV